MPRNSFVQGFNFIRTLGNPVYAIKEMKKTFSYFQKIRTGNLDQRLPMKYTTAQSTSFRLPKKYLKN